MKKYLIPTGIAIALVLVLFFAFDHKPPKVSAFDERREKLIDSLQYPNSHDLESMHKDMLGSTGGTRAALLQQLSDKWMELGQPSIAADYIRQLADSDPSYENYMRAGSSLGMLIDYEAEDDIRVNLVYGARYSYEQAEKLKPGDLDARIGLASVLVSGGSTPMEGIMMLREMDAEDPNNVKINLELGKFSVMSGQYDKALERFDRVLQKDSLNLQARYMRAQSFLGIQDTAKAIMELETLKSYTKDQTLIDQVDNEIKNLNH